ncbi:Do family serine endopeptidase [Alloacidobacterium sp.]|uniref:Do family serine endopeptidase n=1 Tax=Alloacidobacterium sp. TaxID=2951999 RepID=UPI002D59E2EE|nr:Do family serine endopeptidase [Alloacidobacterium sp.]HYK36089.1 Do family serine endopeptidase [Alloacidobacterium sp.]
MNTGKLKSLLKRRVVIPAIVAGAALSLGAYTLIKSGAAVMAAPSPAPAAAPLDDSSVGALLSLDQAMEALAARVTPAVVNVTVTSKVNQQQMGEDGGQDGQQQQMPPPMFGPNTPFGRFFQMPQQQGPEIEHGLGSGVIISPDGYIVTNNHVIDGAMTIHVTMSNRQVYTAKLIGADPLTDLAVIKIDGQNLPSIPWGDSTKLHQGQLVLAFGNPLGFRFTVTRGIISALNRPNPSATDRRKPGEFIQTDAAINQGNSGGALVNARGELIGINTFIISPTGSFAGMGFAIPEEIVKHTADTLIKDGKVRHGFMGVTIADVTPDNAKFFDMNKASGAVVSDVNADSPGAKAGLKTGDVIIALDGKEVTDAGELQMEVAEKQAGDTIHLEVTREGKNLNVPVTLEPAGSHGNTEVAENNNGKGHWGLSLGNLTPDLRNQMQIPTDVHGAVVEDVRSGSPADSAGLQSGDVIVSVNRKTTTSASDAADALKSVPSGQDALLLVWSQGGKGFVVLHPSNG